VLRVSWFDVPLTELRSADQVAAAAVRERAAAVLRPPGALARLDELAEHMAAWQGTDRPQVSRPAVVVFAGDHGVTAGGVSAFPADVTAAMLAAVEQGRATINAMARSVGATVVVVDVGVGRPTGDIRFEPAMTWDQLDATAARGAAAVDDVVARGADLFVLGELGIGNTTVAAAISYALLGGAPDDWVGRGTGVDDDGLQRKRDAIELAVRRLATERDAIDVLREVGGAEFVAMAAACLRARHHGVPVALDGYVATAAVLPLHAACPGALDHCIAGHRSAEPGHGRLLDHLGMRPLLELDLRLGEGSGALAAVPLIAMACASVTEVATFDEWFGAAP
jgi:nicotinate-nucleotide--dimethylbenzimidazole phosphoribosyltransferase